MDLSITPDSPTTEKFDKDKEISQAKVADSLDEYLSEAEGDVYLNEDIRNDKLKEYRTVAPNLVDGLEQYDRTGAYVRDELQVYKNGWGGLNLLSLKLVKTYYPGWV